MPVLGMKDRATGQVVAEVSQHTDEIALHDFVNRHRAPEARLYTDGGKGYRGLTRHEWVYHTRGEYVRGDVHINGIESFWAMLKRAHKGVFHYISPKHLQRYINELAFRHNMMGLPVMSKMEGS